MIEQRNISTEEWEARLGSQVRAARVAAGLQQSDLAGLANVSLTAISSLERGRGSSLRTLVAVVRALGRTEWLELLSPAVTVSPLRMLRSAGATRTPQRVRRPRPTEN